MKMNIKQEEINKLVKELKKLNYRPATQNNSYIFFPIEEEKVVEEDGFQLTIKADNSAKGFLKAGIAICIDQETNEIHPVLGYAELTYCPDFSMEQFIKLTNSTKLSDKEMENLSSYRCNLVPKQNMFAMYLL